MIKIRGRLGITSIVVLLVSISVLVLAPVACTSGEDKGNPKLDSQLNQLVDAERRGEAASFAEQSGLELVNESVRVIIECVPGELEVAAEAATDAGARLETSHDDLLQVVVPITSLITLADEPSIRFIRLPQYPVPATAN